MQAILTNNCTSEETPELAQAAVMQKREIILKKLRKSEQKYQS